jgi:putative tryptophan/tyrosine transport system substrate-binding protein
MNRRDFTLGLLLAAAARAVCAQEAAKQHRIAIVEANSVRIIDDPGNRYWQAFWEQLRRLGDVEGQNLAVARYSVEGRPDRDIEVAREAVNRNPDVVVAVTNHIAQAVHAANETTPIVLFGGSLIADGIAGSLAHPGGKITGVDSYAGDEIWGKLLQLLKETVPSVSKVAFLALRGWGGSQKQVLQDASQQLQISFVPMLINESTPSEYERVFAEIATERADALMVHARGELSHAQQLIVELAEKNHLPAIYPWREYVEAGGLMAYASDFREFGRRLADDVHEILNGADPGDIPIYLPTKYEFVINLRAANTLGLTIPPALLARADEVIE